MLCEHRRDIWRKSRECGGTLPLHVAVLDEAHRIIPRTHSGGDDRLISAGRETAELFGNMVAEIREWGEGLIIAEQSASRIHTNVLINAATKIVHATSYGEDKDSLCAALALSDREADHLSFLRVGEGLAQIPQTYQPVFLHVPDWRTRTA
jgi:DNA helicase HerA-like ATPase